ncbi:uncharacterized protein VDAG_04566 [Verticillium dahliae VdLs.17]|uniref:Uncharacterized protein n=1 Tax=Verticillium dahliae (strain VdLs.17 / ATCC MYA-4575 / FGSC 10137) TaxID=498257 RepID=G2X3H9_VERDV|nr:uncharacterized protein VDAG_04566 [Verticillium dahliae VdLs.17]EGY23128.1 hypothetical protein VDAG_04566 [Verticillium dahliae VdLs.17]
MQRKLRASVRQAYTSQLSLLGGQLDKGDAVARSSVRRAIKRLTNAMARLLRVPAVTASRNGHPNLDYTSLSAVGSPQAASSIKPVWDILTSFEQNQFQSRAGAIAQCPHP